jgi:hypothetical protein
MIYPSFFGRFQVHYGQFYQAVLQNLTNRGSLISCGFAGTGSAKKNAPESVFGGVWKKIFKIFVLLFSQVTGRYTEGTEYKVHNKQQ